MSAFAAIADDLTGACDVAAELAAAGCRARVVVEPDAVVAEDEAGVVIVNTQSRALAPAEAAARVRRALAARPASRVLKKIDTALRGHVGAELDAALAMTAATGFVLAAIPAAGRVTRGGCQWFGGRLLGETEFARDPEGPGAVSSIPEVIARESTRRVAVVSRAEVEAGGLAEAVRVLGPGIDCFVVDAERDEDVARAVAAILALPGPVVLAGSIALAAALAPYLPEAGTAAGAPVPSVPLPALVVNGSLHSRARAQVDAVLATGRACFVLAPAERGPALAAAAAEAAAALGRGTTVVVAPAPTGTVPDAAALRANEALLADLTAAIAERVTLPTLVVIGGETSYAVLRRLEAGAIDVHGRIAPLVACGTIARGVAAGARLVTKGGSGGEPNVIAAVVAAEGHA